ncbi:MULTISPECIES: NADPH-dependent FMN reductase [unclassified Streptomyces]|jgi:NAD(P)H-dependent FMN reductase|uniref:UrdO n=1 Tax=Streptomyces fradiae TaxID=1906 RepID=Q9RP96_STRFR|nr:NAD(P)H-dependent oxidoreductase [Streptomyces sp. E5N91]AAF00220.1 UrdO [Streptomyces fradiae]
MSDAPVRLAVIIGSVREGRFGPTVANWFAGEAKQHDAFEVDVIDLAEANLPGVLPAFGATPAPETVEAVGKVTPRLENADAFVVVTPEYNHSYPASVKTLIDWHNAQWHAKPIGFVSYGGLSGGLRAVEHLRVVFAEVHAITIRDTVSFHSAWSQFDETGLPRDPEGCTAAAQTLLGQLSWWARALREARTREPYKV